MDYIKYLKQPHYLAILCALLSILLAYAESKYSKTKNSSKYYIKVGVIVFINVYLVLQLVIKGFIPIYPKLSVEKALDLGKTTLKGGASAIVNNVDTSVSNNGTDLSINKANYQNVDIGNPNF